MELVPSYRVSSPLSEQARSWSIVCVGKAWRACKLWELWVLRTNIPQQPCPRASQMSLHLQHDEYWSLLRAWHLVVAILCVDASLSCL